MPDTQFEQLWDMYVAPIKIKTTSLAQEIAEKDGRSEVTAPDIFDALREYIPGHRVPASPVVPVREPGWWNKNVNGFIGITAALTLGFGILGLLPLFPQNLPDKYVSVANGLLEIAKIFAGALVGGAAGAVAITAKK